MWHEKHGAPGGAPPDIETTAINGLLCCVRSKCIGSACVLLPFAIFILAYLCVSAAKQAVRRALLIVALIPPGMYIFCGVLLICLACHRQISSDTENAETAHRSMRTKDKLNRIAVVSSASLNQAQNAKNREFLGRFALFVQAAKTGNLIDFTFCLDSGQNVDEVDHLGRSALHWAALSGMDGIVDKLLRNGASVDMQDKLDGLTPLHYSAYYGHIKVTRQLVNAGATLTIMDVRRMTPLQLAEMASLKLSSTQPSHQMIIKYLRIAMKDDVTPPLEHITGLTVQNLVDRQMHGLPQAE